MRSLFIIRLLKHKRSTSWTVNSVSGCLKTSIALLNSVFFSHDIFHKGVLVLSLPISPSPVITHHFVSNTHHLVIVKNNKPFLFSFPTLLKGGVEKGGGGRVFLDLWTQLPPPWWKTFRSPKLSTLRIPVLLTVIYDCKQTQECVLETAIQQSFRPTCLQCDRKR